MPSRSPPPQQHGDPRSPQQQPAHPSFEELLFPDAAAAGDGNTGVESIREPHPAGHGAPVLDPHAPGSSPLAGPAHLVPVYSVKLVRTDTLALRERPRVHHPADVAALLGTHLASADREHFAALLLDAKNRLIGVTTVSVGDLSSALVHPREVFKPAILASAASIIVGHNHPSGDMEPSPEDIAVTRRLAEAGEILGIVLLDHVIVGERGSYRSLKEGGCL